MRALICGGRDFTNYQIAKEVLANFPITFIIEGGARGADFLGRKYAIDNSIPYQTFPADWNRYRNGAGPIRNKQMLDEGKPDIVIAFPGGSGTRNMMMQTEKAKIPLVEIYFKDEIWRLR